MTKPVGYFKPCKAAVYRKATADLARGFSPRVVVEVGVYEGALSAQLAALPSLEVLHIVDSWDGRYSNFGQKHMDRIAANVMKWAEDHPKVQIHRMDSLQGAALFADESIDFFHTDGDHTLEGIRGDILAWLPKVKPGGILSGDNYEAPTVAQGVTELLPSHSTGANGRLWWVRK